MIGYWAQKVRAGPTAHVYKGRDRNDGWVGVLRTLLSSIVGLAPGLVLPFVISSRLSPSLADLFLLAYSIALTLTNVAANTIEQNTIAEYGRYIGKGETPSSRSWRRYVRGTRAFALTSILFGFPLLVLLYGSASGELRQLFVASIPLLAMPFIASIAAERSARIIVLGFVSSTILLQSCRAILPLSIVFLFPTIPLWGLTAAITCGELIRLLGLSILYWRVRPAPQPPQRRGGTISSRGLWWQASSMVTSQAGSVTDRAFLGAAPAGAVAAYEISDKILYAGVQVFVSGMLLRSFSKWAQLAESSVSVFTGSIKRHLRLILVSAVLASMLAVGAIEVAIGLNILDSAWITGLRWGQLSILSMPLSILMTAMGRVLVIRRSQQYLVPLVVVGLASNLILDIVLFGPFGGFGILLSSVASRVIGAVAYLAVVIHVIRKWRSSKECDS